jgi:pimeloyl-ACP methyl ester carboxylesterase
VSGFQDFTFPNLSGKGTHALWTTVYYPALSEGWMTPIVPRAGGHPVLVFLHGSGLFGHQYPALARNLSDNGYVVVLTNTALTHYPTQVDDARALFPALGVANATPSHFLFGALDMSRVGLFGHSMGGSGTFNTLIFNPGYVVALGLAAVYPGPLVMNYCNIPFGIIHGEGDPVIPWQAHGQRTYLAPSPFADLKFFYLFDETCDHHAVVGLRLSPAEEPIWERSARVMLGFFDRFLRDRYEGLEEVVGAEARNEPLLSMLEFSVASPDLWSLGGQIGANASLNVVAEAGPAALFAAPLTAAVTTPFGLLELEPSVMTTVFQTQVQPFGLLSWQTLIPNQPSLIGTQIPFQGIGLEKQGQLAFTNLAWLRLEAP